MARREPRRREGVRYGDGYVLSYQLTDGTERVRARWPEPQDTGHTIWRSKSFPDQDAAEDHLRDVARKKRHGRYVPPSNMTVKDAVGDYLDRGEGRWKPATHAAYRQRAERLIYPDLGTLRIEGLTTGRIQHWIDDARRRKYGPNTIENSGRVLTAALAEAARLGIIPVNPAVGLRYPIARKKKIPTWSVAEVQRVIVTLAGEPMWDAFYRVALSTGMRPGELCAIQWADVDLDAGIITVQRSLTKDLAGHVVMGESTKTGRERENAIPASAVAALRAWSTEQKRRRLASAVWHDDGMVFDRGDGRFLARTTWQRVHAGLIETTGVTPITLHQLRHTNATLEVRAGTNVKLVSERLGHRSVQITLDLYSHTSRDDHRRAADDLGDRLFGAAGSTTT